MSLTSPFNTPAWIDAPAATASSGFTPLCGSLPVSSCTRSATAGIRVEPPTRMTWSIVDLSRPASRIACSNGPRHASSRSRVISWKRARVSESSRCNGPSFVAVTNGRLIDVSCKVGELDLRLLGRFLQPLRGHLVDRRGRRRARS